MAPVSARTDGMLPGAPARAGLGSASADRATGVEQLVARSHMAIQPSFRSGARALTLVSAIEADLEAGALAADPHLDEVEAVARIGSYVTDLVAGRWTSSKGLGAIFGIDAAFDRSIGGWASLVHPDEREAMLGYLSTEIIGRGRPFDRVYRIVRADNGETRWVHGRGRVELDTRGRPHRLVGTIADVTERVVAEQALLLSEQHYRTLVEESADGILVSDPDGRYIEANPAICRMLGLSRDELLALDPPTLLAADDSLDSGDIDERLALTAADAGLLVERRYRCSDGSSLPTEVSFTRLPDGRLHRTIRDISSRHAAERARERLAAAVEQASDSIVITDLAGTIDYVNPAFERISGYRADEVIGQSPRLLKSGRHSAGLYRALWRKLVRGETWTGSMVNRRKDGVLYEVEATISPIHGPGGAIAGFVGVERDVTAVRAAESALAAEFRERTQVAAALARLKPAPTAEETAAEICGELAGLPGIDAVTILDFPTPGQAIVLALDGPDGIPFSLGSPLPANRAAYLYGRALQGPWSEAWKARPEDGAYGIATTEAGIKASAFAPIRNGNALLGLVAVGTRDEEYARHLIDHLPVVGEFAAAASALLSRQLEWTHRSEVERVRIERVLAERRFSPVFQPIMALATTEPVGYEALTRFTSGTRPDAMLARALEVGLDAELELALIAAALEASASFGSSTWLSLNISPKVLLQAIEPLAALLHDQRRRIVLELTERAQIDDYPAVRGAIARLGPRVSLAVDDAGSGFASLRHVVELRPQYLKIDLSLVRHVDSDPTRRAMVGGLAHFAVGTQSVVIAEGIETTEELATLQGLGVPLGQGYLLGRPSPSGRWASRGPGGRGPS